MPRMARGVPSSVRSETGSHTDPPPLTSRDRKLMCGLNPAPIQIFNRIDDDDCPDVKIENVQQHGSYSWVDAKEPTILVPGTRSLSVGTAY